MSRFRPSFTARLLLLVTAVVVVLTVIDYLTLLDVPRQVSRDTIELAMRDDVQSLIALESDNRATLRTDVNNAIDNINANPAESRKLAAAVTQRQLDQLFRPRLDAATTRWAIVERDENVAARFGPISVIQPIFTTDSAPTRAIAFYRPLHDAVLNQAVSDTGAHVSFAIESGNTFIARSKSFPRSLQPDQLNSRLDTATARVREISVDGEQRHIYSQALGRDSDFQLHAVSSAKLERNSYGPIRGTVRNALTGMALATFLAFLLVTFFTSRTVRRFASRVRTLADGDYGSRMQVVGGDSFASLATNVNRLSVQLQEHVGALERSAAAFRTTLEALDEGISVWSADGEIVYWNPGAERLTSLALQELRSERGRDLLAFLRSERVPGTRRVTLPVERLGSALVVDLVASDMPDGGVVQTFRDSTVSERLQQMQRNFMATAAHELRTPVTMIVGFSDTLLNPDLNLAPAQRDECIAIIREQSGRLQDIADALFVNHQLSSDTIELTIIAVRVRDVVRSVLDRLRPARSDAEDALHVDDVEVHVEPDVLVSADRRALFDVLHALVENALLYGAAPVSIRASVEDRDGAVDDDPQARAIGTTPVSGRLVRICVTDAGGAIDPYHQARLFDPFYRIDVDMRAGIGGAGLGLFAARKFAEAMHGQLAVRSSPDDGTVFTLTLPEA